VKVFIFLVEIFFDYSQRVKFKSRIDRKSFVIKHINRTRVTNILEIGVFNGNFGERMILAAKKNSHSKVVNYVGVDLFKQGITQAIYQSEVSLMPLSIEDIMNRLSRIENTKIELIQGKSTNTLPKLIGRKLFDVIVEYDSPTVELGQKVLSKITITSNMIDEICFDHDHE
jgi:tRNA G46 methylase TrmB